MVMMNPADFIVYRSYKNVHYRADQVKKAVGKIVQCGNPQHSRLRGPAGIPRDKYRGDRGGIFESPA